MFRARVHVVAYSLKRETSPSPFFIAQNTFVQRTVNNARIFAFRRNDSQARDRPPRVPVDPWRFLGVHRVHTDTRTRALEPIDTPPLPSSRSYRPSPLSPVSVLRHLLPIILIVSPSPPRCPCLCISLGGEPSIMATSLSLSLHPLVVHRDFSSPSLSSGFCLRREIERASPPSPSRYQLAPLPLFLPLTGFAALSFSPEYQPTPSPLSLDPGESRAARAPLSQSLAQSGAAAT